MFEGPPAAPPAKVDGPVAAKEEEAVAAAPNHDSAGPPGEAPFDGRCYSRDSIPGALAKYPTAVPEVAPEKSSTPIEGGIHRGRRSTAETSSSASSVSRRGTAMGLSRSRSRRASRPGMERRRSSAALMVQSSIRNLGKRASNADLRFDVSGYSRDSALGALIEKKPIVRSNCCADGKCLAMQNFFLPPGVEPLETPHRRKKPPVPLVTSDEEGNSPEEPRVVSSSNVQAAKDLVHDAGSRVGRSKFHVEGICCASETPLVEGILRPIPGVVEVSVNPTTRTVYVDHNVDVLRAKAIAILLTDQGFSATVIKDAGTVMDQQMAGIPTDVFVKSTFDLIEVSRNGVKLDEMKGCLFEEFSREHLRDAIVSEDGKVVDIEHNPYYLTAPGIVETLADYSYNIKILSDGGADGMWALSSLEVDAEDTIEQQTSTVRWTVVLSGVFWVISMFSLVGGNWEYLKYVALLSVAFGLPPVAIKACKTLRRLRFDVNCMILFAVLGALPLQEYTEAAAVTFLFAISETLETRATARARNALSAIVSLRPEYANVINPLTKQVVILPANSVAVGAVVSVRTGDKIPCDGVVIEGKSTVDECSLTGESRPVSKSPGDKVSGGTINTGNTQLVIKSTATANNSAVSRLIQLIEEAQSNRSDTEKMVDSFARIYTPVVVLVALCMCTIPWAFGTETGKFWAMNGLITIVIACPCALIISTPVTYVAGLAAAAQKGVIVKGGQHLEGLGRVKSIAFDKTGTLSRGVFALLHFDVIGETRSRKEVLGMLALIEAPASHPLSDAIVKGAANEQVDIPKLKLENHTLLPGEGITANVEGKNVHVGNRRLFERLGLYDELPEDAKVTTEGWANAGGTTGFISIEGEGIVGAYCVADKIRDETKDVVAALKGMGIEITMLTGDQRPAALGIGGQIGLDEDDIRSELLPQDKLVEIGNMVDEFEEAKQCWRAKRTVMMVGDGVNDAPALALADVSVAMGEGAALAMDTADVTLMDSNLNKLLYIVRMGSRVNSTIIENVAFSLIVKAVVMGFTFAGKAFLWAAIASDVGAMLIVTLNGMKLLPSSRAVKKNDLATEAAEKREAA